MLLPRNRSCFFSPTPSTSGQLTRFSFLHLDSHHFLLHAPQKSLEHLMSTCLAAIRSLPATPSPRLQTGGCGWPRRLTPGPGFSSLRPYIYQGGTDNHKQLPSGNTPGPPSGSETRWGRRTRSRKISYSFCLKYDHLHSPLLCAHATTDETYTVRP